MYAPLSTLALDQEKFAFSILLDGAAVYRAELFAGDLIANRSGKNWKFVDKAAKAGGGNRSGLFSVRGKRQLKDGRLTYALNPLAFGDFSGVVSPELLLQISIGGDVAYTDSVWNGDYGKQWKFKP